METQMQRKKIAWTPGQDFKREKNNNNKVVSFSTLFLMFRLTWITEKELGRQISLEETYENFIARLWEKGKY